MLALRTTVTPVGSALASGYRAVQMMYLAEKYYGRVGIAEGLMKKDRRFIRPKGSDV